MPKSVRIKIKRFFIWLGFCTVFILALFVALELCMRPQAMLVCGFKAKEMANEAINHSSIDLTNMVLTDDIVFIERDAMGRITAVTTDSNRIATYAATMAQDIQDRINAIGPVEVDVFLSEVIGGQVISGIGPAVKMRFTPVSIVSTGIRSEFESVSINQTRHSMIADINVKVRVTLPLQTEIVELSTSSILTETIIVGDVPGTYLNSNGSNRAEDMYDLVPD